MLQEKKENNRYTVDFAETKVICFGGRPFIVPEDLSILEQKYLIASQYTLSYGNVSVDYVLKKYFNEYEHMVTQSLEASEKSLLFEKNALVSQTLKRIKALYGKSFNILDNLDFSNPTESNLVCEMVFKRMHSGFKACRFLIKYGFYFETYAIQRQILDQLAFTFYVTNKNTYEEYNQPNKCIIELKKFYPKAGAFYGLLCDRTHIDKTQIRLYRKIDHDDVPQIIQNSIDYSLETILDFIQLLDGYCSTYEYCFKRLDKHKKLSYITPDDQIRDDRPTIALVNFFKAAYTAILKKEAIEIKSNK